MDKLVCIKKPPIWIGKYGAGVGPSTLEVCTPVASVDQVWLVLAGYPPNLLYHQQYFRPLDLLDHQLENIEIVASWEYHNK
jgi:hypothetical protein